MTAEHPEQPGRVPVGELRALVERWDSSVYHRTPAWECAEELAEVIERYE